MSPASQTREITTVTISSMKPEPAAQDNQETELRLAGIFQRIERGDTSVTDEVFWLQAHEDLVTGPKRESSRD